MQDLAIVRNPIQPLVVADLIATASTTKAVLLLVACLVVEVYKDIVAPLAKVVLGPEVADDVVVYGAADITSIITAAYTVATLLVNVMFLLQSRALP